MLLENVTFSLVYQANIVNPVIIMKIIYIAIYIRLSNSIKSYYLYFHTSKQKNNKFMILHNLNLKRRS